MAGFFDDTENAENTTSPVGKSFFDDTEVDVPERTVGDTIKDVGISLAKGIVGAGEGFVGLADIPTGGKVGKVFESISIKPKEWQKSLSEELSPAQQAANKKVDNATGFIDTAKAMLENPSTIAHGIVETIPSVAAGGVIGKGALALGTRFAPQAISALGKTGAAIAASSIGEGAISAGQTAEEIRNQTVDKELTAGQSGLALASGVGTGIFGAIGGSLAKKLGFADVDTMIVNGLNPAKKEGLKGVAKSIIGGGITESVFEELPQTVQETIFTNAALDKPLLEGVPEGAAQAIILGGVMGGGANLLPGAKSERVKTDQEFELERRAGNILSLEKPKLDESIQRLNNEIQINQELLNDPVKFDQRVKEQNITPEELIRQLITTNKDNQDLLNKVTSGLKAMDEQAKIAAQKEYNALSPEEKQIKDATDKLNAKRQESAIAINDQINTIDEQLNNVTKAYESLNLDGKQTPEDKQKLSDEYIRLNKEKNRLLDRYKEEVVKSDLAPYTTREERQKYLENLFGTYNRTVPANKDAQESFQVFEANDLMPVEIANYANGLIQAKTNQQALNTEKQALRPIEENNLKQITDYANYIKGLSEKFTPAEQATIENYWQGVKKELNLRNEEMTPGTEAFMRKRFFETQLDKIENNVKQDIKPTTEANKQVVPSLAEQNKRQVWFKQIATELGDFAKTNPQEIQAEIPRNLPGGITDTFTNEQQVGNVPQFQVSKSQKLSNISLTDIQKTFPNQTIKQSKDGIISIKFKNGKGLTINSIQDAGNDFISFAIETGQMSKNDEILGITVGNNILLDSNFADNRTLWHENKHVLDNLGLITTEDDSALNKEFNKLRKIGKLEFALSTHKDPIQAMRENRANMFAQIMANRAQYRNTGFGKVIQRVMDFFSQLFSLGKQTVSGLARDVESGRIYERKVGDQTIATTIPQTEAIASKWHSALENAVNGFQQKIATPDQWKGMLKGYPGIKQEELDWIGLDEWLDSKDGKVNKDDLMKFIAENNVRLEEVVKGSEQIIANNINEKLSKYGYRYQDNYEDWYLYDPNNNVVEVKDAPKEIQAILQDGLDSYNFISTKYDQYQLPGGKNYKEMLITAPAKETSLEQDAQAMFGKSFMDLSEEEYKQFDKEQDLKIQGKHRSQYQSNHWNEPNIITHIRFNERTDAEGNKILFLEEVQSDWHQAGRKSGYETTEQYDKIKAFADQHGIKIRTGPKEELPIREQVYLKRAAENTIGLDLMEDMIDAHKAEILYSVPDAPFKKSWPLLAMKRMIRYAAENGFDKIAWTTGQQQADRYGEENIKAEGMKGFYDQMLPAMLNKEFNRGKWGNARVEQTQIGDNNKVKIDTSDWTIKYITNDRGRAAYELYDSNGVMRYTRTGTPTRAEALEQAADRLSKIYEEQNFSASVLSLPITNRMKSKALREGMPMFEVREAPTQKISDETYNQMFAERNNLVRTIGQTLRMRGHEIKQLIDKGLGSISTRLKNVDPMLRAEIRNLDFRTSQKIVNALRIAHPLLEKTKEMSPEDKFVWDAARRNSDEAKIKQIADKYGMTADQEKLRNVLNQIRQDAIDVGYDVGFIEEYWPRIIKDQEGFLQATKGISQRPVITDAIKKYADKLGMSVEKFEATYPEQAADIASNTILGRNLGIGGPGNIQARQYETVPPELNKFYMDSDAALMQYIYSMTKKIEARRFFGKVPERIANLKTEKTRKQSMLQEAQVANNNDRVEELSGDLLRIEQELDKYKLQRDYTENIGTYINELRMSGRIQADEEKMVRDILDARFHEHGTTGIVNAYKNMAYIDVMGSPISALTQIGDLAWAMYVGKVWTPKGLSNTVKNIGKAFTKQSEITKEDLGIERIAQEFADGTTLGNAVNWVFRKVGLEKIDSIGKEVLINNALDNYKSMASTESGRTELLKQIKPIFGTQSDSVINDLLANNPTDNVKMLLYHRLLDFQPVALSEMPEQYLKGGNGRVFYMLKTYTLKQFDVFRNEAWHKIKSGEKDQVIEGIGNMIKLASLLTLANAGADELKDLLLGKDINFEDHVVENFLTMGGASKYVRMQTAREGLGSGLIGQILPPFRFINSASKDLNQIYGDYVAGDTINFDHARIVESIPIVGKFYYWNYGRGEDYKKSSNEQEFSDVGKDVDLFKRQFENAQDKRTFLNANLDKFKQMKLHENFKASLARNQAVINKLKDIPQTTNVRERLGQLKQQRELILKKYFEVTNTMQ